MMVNNATEGQSQGTLRWRFVVMLMCKSFAELGYWVVKQ